MLIRSTACLVLILSTTFGASAPASAGFNGLTWASRANCVNNESISWHYGKNYLLATTSHHYTNWSTLQHIVDTGWQYTWRSAAVHWGEGVPPTVWRVIGTHFINVNNQLLLLGITDTANCSIYDGWWDV